MIYKVLSLCLSISVLVGCATIQMSPVKREGVQLLLSKGQHELISKKKNSIVSIRLEPKMPSSSYLELRAKFENLSNEPAYIDREKIKISRVSDKTPAYILSYEDLKKKVKTANVLSAITAELGGGGYYTVYKVSKNVLRPSHVKPEEDLLTVFTAKLPAAKDKTEQFKIEVGFAGDIHIFQIEKKK